MKNVFIIADDTTGANSSAILLKKLGYECYSIHSSIEDMNRDSVYAFSTDSRNISKDIAYERVNEILLKLENKESIFNKRIDSTLRGNLGSELDAFLDYFENKKAIVVPCFPDSGRTCINNTLYVNGVLLENTDVAKDPKAPVNTSNVNELFKKQTNRSILSINIDDVRSDKFNDELLKAYNEADIVIIDAETNQDIDLIAKTIVQNNLDIVTVGPGPLTYHYSKHVNKPKTRFHGLIGSVTPLSLTQLRYIKEIGGHVFDLDMNRILGDEFEEYKKECLEELLKVENDIIMITTLSFDYDGKIDLNNLSATLNKDIEELSAIINNRISKIFVEFNRKIKPGCVYTSGGDTTVEFLNQIQSYGVKLDREILPLTVSSKILGGEFNGLHLVSKGGLIGEENTIEFIYNYMKEGNNHE